MKTQLKVRKSCAKYGACEGNPEDCPHPWVYDPMIYGKRVGSVDIDAYAAVRGGPRHVKTEEQGIQWAARVEADWLNGKNPRLTPEQQADEGKAAERTVRKLVDAYRAANAADPILDPGRKPRLKQPQVVRSELRHIAEYFAEAPAVDLAQVSYVQQFADELADGWAPHDMHVTRGESGVRHLLVRLRALVRWGMHQHPAWVLSSPFHKHGVEIQDLDDTRSRRLSDEWDEEGALLAACATINDKDHQFAGAVMERRILGALTLAGRGSDLDRVRVPHVKFRPERGKWPYVVFLGRTRGGGKAKADRHIHFDPQGKLAELLRARRFLKAPNDYVFGDEDGSITSHYKAWTTIRLLAWGLIRPDGAGRTAEEDQRLLRETVQLQFRDLRRECASRWYFGVKEADIAPLKGGVRAIQQLLGHSTLSQTERYLQLPPGGDYGDALAEAQGWKAPVADATTPELRRTPPVAATRQIRGKR